MEKWAEFSPETTHMHFSGIGPYPVVVIEVIQRYCIEKVRRADHEGLFQVRKQYLFKGFLKSLL